MDMNDIELDLQETPLAAAASPEDATPEAFEQQAQDLIENTDILTDTNGVLVQLNKVDSAIDDTGALVMVQESLVKIGRVSKLDIESILPKCKRTSLESIKLSMFTDVATPINLRRANEALTEEIDAQKIALTQGLTATTRSALSFLANDYEAARQELAVQQGKLNQEFGTFFSGFKTTVMEALDNMGVLEATTEKSSGSQAVDDFNEEVSKELVTSRRKINFIGKSLIDLDVIAVGNSYYAVTSQAPEMCQPLIGFGLDPDQVINLTTSAVLSRLTDASLVTYLENMEAMFQECMNRLRKVEEEVASVVDINSLQRLNAVAINSTELASGIVNTLHSFATVASKAASFVVSFGESINVPETPGTIATEAMEQKTVKSISYFSLL